MYRAPWSAAASSHRSRASSKSLPCSITVASSERIEETFTGLAPRGTKIVAAMPNKLAAYATDCPWLPVDAVYTPATCSCESRWTTRLIPPRTLNAPVGWWFSCLTNSSAPTRDPAIDSAAPACGQGRERLPAGHRAHREAAEPRPTCPAIGPHHTQQRRPPRPTARESRYEEEPTAPACACSRSWSATGRYAEDAPPTTFWRLTSDEERVTARAAVAGAPAIRPSAASRPETRAGGGPRTPQPGSKGSPHATAFSAPGSPCNLSRTDRNVADGIVRAEGAAAIEAIAGGDDGTRLITQSAIGRQIAGC